MSVVFVRARAGIRRHIVRCFNVFFQGKFCSTSCHALDVQLSTM